MDFDLVTRAIEAIAPLSGAASWDMSGIQVASRRSEIKTLAVALDPTPSTVRQALDQGADMLLTHHPLSLTPQLPSHLDKYHEVLSMLFRDDVSLYAAHTSLDVQPDGPAGWLARHLCLRHPAFLQQTGEKSGFGLAGSLREEIPFRDLLKKLGERIDLSCAVLIGDMPETVKRIAYCTGSGSSLMRDAWTQKADVYITGDVKYHAALDCTGCILDVGHHSLEEEMMHEMQAILARRLDGSVNVFFIPSSSPFHSVSGLC